MMRFTPFVARNGGGEEQLLWVESLFTIDYSL